MKQNEKLKKRVHISNGFGTPTAKRLKRSGLSSSENDEYEVDSILDHKKEKGQMCFLIHWKNYDSSHDSWERQSNLKCTVLLNRYKKAKNLS